MKERIVRWLLLTVFFSFIPSLVSITINFVLEGNPLNYNFSSDLLFLTLLISASSLTDIISLKHLEKNKWLFIIFGFFFSLATIFSTALYTCHIVSNIIPSVRFNISKHMLMVSLTIALLLIIVGFIEQILIGLNDEYKISTNEVHKQSEPETINR